MSFSQNIASDSSNSFSPQIIAALTKDTSMLSSEQLETLKKINQLERVSESLIPFITQDLQKTMKVHLESVQKNLNSLDITKDEKELVSNIYNRTILSELTKTIEIVKKQKEEEKEKKFGRLYTAILSESLVNVLDGILSYQKEIDELFPKASDKIWSAMVPVIITSVSFLSPVVGGVLATSGLLNIAADFMKTDNLSKTVEKMKEDLALMKKDTKLKPISKELDKSKNHSHSEKIIRGRGASELKR